MAINWKAVSDNLVNISLVLTDFMDSNNAKDIAWVFTDDSGNIENINIPNIAKVLQEKESDLANTVETTIGEYLMFSNTEPTATINPKYLGFLYVKYDATKPDRSEIYICVDNTTDNNVWGKISGGILVIYVTDDITLETGYQYVVDTSTKSINLTLPATPSDNDLIIMSDGRNNAQNQPVNVLHNGININDTADDLVCDINGFYVQLVYNATANSWYVINKN